MHIPKHSYQHKQKKWDGFAKSVIKYSVIWRDLDADHPNKNIVSFLNTKVYLDWI